MKSSGLFFFACAESVSRFALGDATHVWEVRAGALLLLCYNVRFFNLNAYRALEPVRGVALVMAGVVAA